MTSTFYWTGIGSRETPQPMKNLMERIARGLETKGGILRSGGAPGADDFFEMALRGNRKEIYLPQAYFNKKKGILLPITPEVESIASKAHPGYAKMKKDSFAYRAHSRNVFQVLGSDLKSPSKFVVCYTPDGAEFEKECHSIDVTGGTRTAIVIASQNNVPVFNLARPDALVRLQAFVRDNLQLEREPWAPDPATIEKVKQAKLEKRQQRYQNNWSSPSP